jgi:flavin reductase (DIM6/NTAB) family NADH-FMN oxidoreductase RutF
MAATVTLWTAGEPGATAGLTVSSMLVAGGQPWRVLGLVDPDADIVDGVQDTGRLLVSVLRWRHRALADAFAGIAPAPGGPFRLAEWEPTPWGPALSDASAWAGCRLTAELRQVGWSLLVQADVEHVHLSDDDAPLLHRRGRYFTA